LFRRAVVAELVGAGATSTPFGQCSITRFNAEAASAAVG